MKKLLIGLVIIVIISLLGLVVTKKYIGNIAPAVLPHLSLKKFTPIQVKRGKALDVPLQVPAGYQVGIFVDGLGGLRDMTFSPQGLLLVSDTGSGKVIALPDANDDGIADDAITVLSGLRRPHGLAFYKNKLYVVEETSVKRYIWAEKEAGGGQLAVARLDKILFSLPQGDRHFTRSIAIADDGTMYISLGSTCDSCIEKSPFLASIISSDAEGSAPKVYATGLRNATFITFNPTTHELWGTEMGRDFLGDEAPPDEINVLRGNTTTPPNFGWPHCYGNKIQDKNFDPAANLKELCAKTTPPIYEIPTHSAPLGLTFIDSTQFPAEWQGDLLVAYHGSWNRSIPTGYKVVHMHVKGNTITGAEDFLTGFLQDGTAIGRPVDIIFDKNGNLYVSDDKVGKVYIISKK